MGITLKQWVVIGALGGGALLSGCTDRSAERPIASQPSPSPNSTPAADSTATGGSGMAGPANESHATDSRIHEAPPSAQEANAPSFSPENSAVGQGKVEPTEEELGTGGAGKAGMAKDGGHGMHMDAGMGGSGYDGLGTDVESDRGTQRDSDKGSTMDNGTSQDVTPPTPVP